MKKIYILAAVLAAVIATAGLAAGVDISQAPQLLGALLTPENAGVLMAGPAGVVGMQEIKSLIQAQGDAWQDFKHRNDRILADQSKQIQEVTNELGIINERMAGLQLSGFGGAETSASDVQVFAAMTGQHGMDPETYGDYRRAIGSYMRMGGATPQNVMASMSVGSDPDGGYTVPPDMSGKIISRIHQISPMRQIAAIQSTGRDALEGFNDLQEPEAGWVAETQERTDTDTPQLGMWAIPVHEIYAQPKTTQKLLDDSAWNVENWLIDKASKRFGRMESAAFFSGDGIVKPRGILTYPTSAVADDDDQTRPWGTFEHIAWDTDASPDETTDKLIDLQAALKVDYLQNARWLMNRRVAAVIRKLKDEEGRYIWQPSLVAGQPAQLLGHPVTLAEDMPDVAANALSIAFGDFTEGYSIVDRMMIRLLRDPYTTKGRVKFYMTRRVGGGALNFEAVKFLKCA